VSFCVNFIITSYWTFRSRPSWRKLAGFGGSHIVNYVCQQAFLALFLWAGIAKEYAAIMAMGSAVPVNFMILRVIYKKKPEGPDRPRSSGGSGLSGLSGTSRTSGSSGTSGITST
ncbi:MAG: GtrA family protein, partial [Bacteroidales bacterium]|nr:GtrA family protein [Bacteroidales bacterium]MDY5449296.1 GtrA family protein [Prevotella sp.]